MKRLDNQSAWYIGGYRFVITEIIRTSFASEFHVRVNPPEPSEGFNLDNPEPFYETESGAHYAILLFLETLRGELKG